MNDLRLADLLTKARTIAIVGAKDTPGRAVDRVGRYLLDAGYEIIPIHPVRKSVWGIPAYPSLAEAPGPIDIVDVFRAAEYCEDHAKEVAALPRKPLLFWLQLGICNDKALGLMTENGIAFVQDACLMVDHARLFSKTPVHE